MNDDKLATVLRKIAACRALAARASTQAEAETAAAQAAALVAKYHIDAPVAVTTTLGYIVEGDPLWEGANAVPWIRLLAAGLAKDNGVHVVRCVRASGQTIRIAGRPADIEIVRYLFAWLTTEIGRLSEQEPSWDQNAFRLGCVQGVLASMRAAKGTETRIAASRGVTAAIVLSDITAKSTAFLHQVIGGAFSSEGVPLPRGAAFERGASIGSGIGQRPMIANGAVVRMLGDG